MFLPYRFRAFTGIVCKLILLDLFPFFTEDFSRRINCLEGEEPAVAFPKILVTFADKTSWDKRKMRAHFTIFLHENKDKIA